MGIDQTPLGGFCGIVPFLEFGGCELGGLFLLPPPPIETHAVLSCIMVGICVLTETIIVTSTWAVYVHGHTPFGIGYIIKFHITIIRVPTGKP